MVFKKEEFLIEVLSSFILVFRNFFLLIFYPYKTVRRLSLKVDYYQTCIIFFFVFLYFKFAYFLRNKPYPATLTFFLFLFNFCLTLFFFYFFGKIFGRKSEKSFSSLVFTFSYSLFPTLIWFGATSILYIFLPPPRTMSILGRGFSIFFIAFSLSLLVWKMILVFLSLRFSLKLNFYQILYIWLLYFSWFIPYSILLYQFRLFRVPFI